MAQKFFIIIFVVLQSVFVFSQNELINYPLQVGNVYVFLRINTLHVIIPPMTIIDSSYVRSTIDKDTLLNSKMYYRINSFPVNYGNLNYYRFDSLTGRFLLCDSSVNCENYTSEKLVDSLWANLYDSVYFCSSFLNQCTDTLSCSIFGSTKNARIFKIIWGGGSHFSYSSKRYADHFGLVMYESGGSGPYATSITQYILKGCIINNVLYGDTSSYLSAIEQISSETPQNYFLGQNYPNPFNPVTSIQFDLTKASFTNITIYDLLGRQIEVLVNSELKPGTYEINWNAEQFTSGVYVYRMEAEEQGGNKFVETKKMILIK